MNVHSKGGIRTIKLDKAERRIIAQFTDLLTELVIYADHLDMTQAEIRENVTLHIDSDGVFDPTPATPAKPAKGTP